MTSEHPTRETLELFFRGSLDEEVIELVEHHLEEEGCLQCVLAGRRFLVEVEPERRENLDRFARKDEHSNAERLESLETGLRQSLCRGALVSGEHTIAPALLAELERRSPEARREAIRTTERYQLFGLAEYLSHASRSAVFSDVLRALEIAGLAIEVADTLDPRIYGPRFNREQQVLARACLGNARRIASDLFGAERSFQEARSLLAEGLDLTVVSADVGSLLGSLRIDQARYLEARSVLEPALETYRVHELRADECKVLLKLADAEGYSGNPERAVEILEAAVPLAEQVGRGRLRLQAHHNLTDWLIDAGQALEALARYEKARPLYDEQCTEPSLVLRRRWLEGRIYAALGDLDLARAAFEEVRATAAARDLSYEVAMVTLELAIVHLDRGDAARVRELAEEMTAIFRSHELHRYALAAVYLFRHAAHSETLTTSFARQILRYLQRARNNPYLRFEASARPAP
jgi:tetratricopeptide (TPR) repeat protein